MKKSFQLEIKTPCDANLEAMDKTNDGFFCHLCTKNVIDLSNKTNYEIEKFITENKNQNICVRLKTTQLETQFQYVEPVSKTHNLKYAVAVAASVLLTSNVVAQENTSTPTEQSPTNPREIMGKMIAVRPQKQVISFTLKGKLLDSTTKKPLSQKQFPNYMMYINGANGKIVVNPKTGEFSIAITLENNEKDLPFSVNSGSYHYDATIPFDAKKIKKNVLKQNIYVNPKEFQKIQIAGGLGVIDVPKEKTINQKSR